MRLLLVEDDVMVASGIKLGLTDAGYAVDWVGSGERALEVLAADLESFADYVRTHVRSLPGVREISTSFSLKEVKRTMALPL